MIAVCLMAYKGFSDFSYEMLGKTPLCLFDWIRAAVGTVVAKEMLRTRRVDKGKSGQALKTAVSGGFGGGILSQDLKASV
jgi:hypothetical protein